MACFSCFSLVLALVLQVGCSDSPKKPPQPSGKTPAAKGIKSAGGGDDASTGSNAGDLSNSGEPESTSYSGDSTGTFDTSPGPVGGGSNLQEGCYRVGAGGFYANSSGHSCAVAPTPFLGKLCGSDDFNKLTARSSHGANAIDGPCRLPAGCYRVQGGGFYSNGQGHACNFSPEAMAGHCNGLPFSRFNELPELPNHWGNQLDGFCQGSEPPKVIAAGCYRIGQEGYISNGAGHSCSVPPAPLFDKFCNTSDFNSISARSDHGSNTLDGACHLPQGCYRIEGGGFYANSTGASCGLSPANISRICPGFSLSNFNSLPNLPNHWGNQYNGPC